MTGRELQRIIREHGIRQYQIAKALGITEQTVSAMMRADSVKTSTLEKISEKFKISLMEFYGLNSEDPKELMYQINELKKQIKKDKETIYRLVKLADSLSKK